MNPIDQKILLDFCRSWLANGHNTMPFQGEGGSDLFDREPYWCGAIVLAFQLMEESQAHFAEVAKENDLQQFRERLVESRDLLFRLYMDATTIARDVQ